MTWYATLRRLVGQNLLEMKYGRHIINAKVKKPQQSNTSEEK